MSEKLSAENLEKALADLRGECVDEAAEFPPEQYEYLLQRMREDLKDGPIVLRGPQRKGRAAD
jgi:hypothetical protein